MDISIVIVNWNTRDILRDCLDSVFEQAGEAAFEVIVVDNASADGSVEMVEQQFEQVILLQNTTNRGFAAANNQAIERAQGRYVLLLNSDTLMLDGALAKAMAYGDEHPRTAVVGCLVLNADRTLQPTCFMFPSLLNMLLSSSYLYKLFPKNRFCGREQMTWWDRNDQCEVEVVTGCFMLVRREAIEQVGVLDEEFFMYGEETDWCRRFREAGWQVRFTPTARIVHLGGASSSQKRSEMILQLRGSILLFFHKHRCWLAYAAACVLVAIFFAARAPYWLIRAAITPKNRDGYWRRARTYARGVAWALTGGARLRVRT